VERLLGRAPGIDQFAVWGEMHNSALIPGTLS
jgi:hypothetical protein